MEPGNKQTSFEQLALRYLRDMWKIWQGRTDLMINVIKKGRKGFTMFFCVVLTKE